MSKKITELDAIDSVASTDLFAVVDVSTSTTKKATVTQVATAIEGLIGAGATPGGSNGDAQVRLNASTFSGVSPSTRGYVFEVFDSGSGAAWRAGPRGPATLTNASSGQLDNVATTDANSNPVGGVHFTDTATVTGLAGGYDGREITLSTGNTDGLTIKGFSLDSDEGNRINTPGESDYFTSFYGSVALRYVGSPGSGSWYIKDALPAWPLIVPGGGTWDADWPSSGQIRVGAAFDQNDELLTWLADAGSGDEDIPIFVFSPNGDFHIGGTPTDETLRVRTLTLRGDSLNVRAQSIDWTDGGAAIHNINVTAVTTTDATVTSLYTFTMTSGGVTAAHSMITACQTSSTNGAAYSHAAAWRVTTVPAATQIGTTQETLNLESNSAWACTIDNSSTTGRVRVTGAAGVNVKWSGDVRTQYTAAAA